MKKFEVKSLVVMLLALAMILSLAACGKPDDTTAPSDLTDPVDTEPMDTDPMDTDPVDTDPVETDPVETDPVETDPVETDPVETDPVETDPVETDPKYDPIETDPVVTDPVETDPVVTEHIHNYKKTILAYPDCENAGEEAMVCECGHTRQYKSLEALGHNTLWAKGGSYTLTHHATVSYCGRCGEIFGTSGEEAHNFVSQKCVADKKLADGSIVYGYEIFVCDGCGYTRYVGSNASDGHYYAADEGSGKMVCDCGKRADADVSYNKNPNAGPQIFAAE